MATASTEVPLDLAPMVAEPVDELPTGTGWQYEPSATASVASPIEANGASNLLSRSQKPLERYFPAGTRALEAIEG